MKNIVFLVVRTASTRLPSKALLQINKIPLIKILIDRLYQNTKIDNVIVCTTNENSDNELCELLKKNENEFFRGNNENIIKRIHDAAKKYDLKQFVIVEGDDLFCEPDFVGKTFDALEQSSGDFVTWDNIPFGVSPIGIKTNKLELLLKNNSIKNTDTGWGMLIMKSGLFNHIILEPENKRHQRPDIRLSIDYDEDFELAKKILEQLPTKFILTDIIDVLEKNPKWIKINENVKKKYWENFTNKMKKTSLNQD